MVRTWGQVVDAAARLWAVLPSAVPGRRSEPDLMLRLRQMANGITATTSAGHWPGPGPTDERLLQIAHNLSRAENPGRALWRGCATHHGRSAGRHRRCPGKDHAHLVRGRSRHRPGDHRTHQRPPRSTSDGHPSPSAGGAASQHPRDQSGSGSVHPVRSLRAAGWRLCRGAPGHPGGPRGDQAGPTSVTPAVGLGRLGHSGPPHPRRATRMRPILCACRGSRPSSPPLPRWSAKPPPVKESSTARLFSG